MKKNLPFDDSYSWNLTLFNSMSPTHKRIACALCVMFKAFKCGDQPEMFWGRDKISKLAKCSETEVTRFKNKYLQFKLIDGKQRKIANLSCKKKLSSNLWKLDERFFTMLYHLKKRGFVKYWHLHGRRLLTEAYENEELAMFKIGYNFEVINKQMSHGECGKCHANVLRDSPNPFRDKVPIKEPPVPDFGHKNKAASEALKIPGLSKHGLAFVDRFGSLYMVQEINRDYEYNLKHGNHIRYPDRWVSSRLHAQMQQQFKVLKGMKHENA